MSGNPIKLFQQDYSKYPNQDTEGYSPDRGSFKTGWFMCYHRFQFLEQQLEDAEKVIEFYANGGNLNQDIRHDEKLGYFTGKKAKSYFKKYPKDDKSEL
jgi:hypothetical protein